jgi:hypothetical protein
MIRWDWIMFTAHQQYLGHFQPNREVVRIQWSDMESDIAYIFTGGGRESATGCFSIRWGVSKKTTDAGATPRRYRIRRTYTTHHCNFLGAGFHRVYWSVYHLSARVGI